MSESIILLPCVAGDHALQFQVEEEEGYVYVSILIPEFHAHQRSFLSRWRERVKLAFTVLRGREYVLEEVILDTEAMEELRIFLSRAALGSLSSKSGKAGE